MRNIDPDPAADFAVSDMDHVAAWLDRRSGVEAWGLVLASMAVVAVLDFSTHAFELCIATLYIVPICLAGWMLRARTAIGITVLVTAVAFLKYPLLHPDHAVFTTIYNGTARALAFGLLTAIMLAFRRSYDHARVAASVNRMTGALNKQTFHERTLQLLDAASEAGRTVLLLYLDLDGFKAVNDQHGHHVGDAVLQAFSADAARTLRREDCFGRLGGDEFGAAIMTGSSYEAQVLAGRLHRRFTAALASSGQGVTCSMGALIVPAESRFPCDELMKEADRLMYASKHCGKNAVTIATASSSLSRRIAAPGIVPHTRELEGVGEPSDLRKYGTS